MKYCRFILKILRRETLGKILFNLIRDINKQQSIILTKRC